MVFDDQIIGDFLAAPKFGSLNLDHTIFNTKHAHSFSSDLAACTDFYQRQSILEACYTDNLINIGLNYMDKFAADFLESFGADVTPAMDLMKDLWTLSSFSSQRSIHWQTAGVTTNKAALRRKLLNKFSIHPKTRQMLSLSSFTNEGIFGRLPESFMKSLRSPHQSQLIAKDKKSNPGQGKGRGLKRSQDYGYPATKKNKFREPREFESSSVFHGKASHPKGGGSRGRAKFYRGGKGKSGPRRRDSKN